MLTNCAVRSQQVIGRWMCPIKHDRTRPVVKYRFWNLTGNDRTLEAERPVGLRAVSGQQMTVEI